MELPAGSRITITRSEQPVLLARMNAEPFTDRLVAKFDLPTNGWRGSAGSVN
jgi:NAD+ kinase